MADDTKLIGQLRLRCATLLESVLRLRMGLPRQGGEEAGRTVAQMLESLDQVARQVLHLGQGRRENSTRAQTGRFSRAH